MNRTLPRNSGHLSPNQSYHIYGKHCKCQGKAQTFISRPGDIDPVKPCCEGDLFLVHLMIDAASIILSEECWFRTAPLLNYYNLFGPQPPSDVILEKCDFLFLVDYEFEQICICFCDLHFAT